MARVAHSVRRCVLSLAGAGIMAIAGAQPLLQRPVEVHAEDVRLSTALDLIAHEAHFKLSYNAAAIKADSVVDVNVQADAGSALRALLGRGVTFKESGEHVIIVGRRAVREVRLRGRVIDQATLAPLAQASVYAVDGRVSAATSADGRFELTVEGDASGVAVRIARSNYRDTVVYADRSGDLGMVALRARERLEPMEPICKFDRCDVEALGVARLLVPSGQMTQAANLDLAERRRFQASLWPSIGTNKELSGAMVNQVSFNFLAGYARGLVGLEVGVGANIERNYVKGVQFAGLANLVGGDTKGAQISGGINHTMRSLEGLQIAGFGNTVWDTLSGVQIAGGANVVKGGMRGTQISGGCNVATNNVDGVQVSGGANVAVRDVRKTQVAGAINYGRNVSGAQVAGGINVALGTVGGGQVAGAINYAREVTGGQVGSGINVAVDTVRGGQVGVLNFARVVRGGQVGVLNFSDTITGTSVGIFSFAWRGYHRIDIVTGDAMPLAVQFRTGTRAFHNILGYSPPASPDGRWGFLYGFGTEPRIGKLGFLNIDLTGEQVVEQPEWADAVNILGRLSITGGFRLNKSLAVTAGPVLNVLVSDWREPDSGAPLSGLPPSRSPLEWRSGVTAITGWYGWKAGIGVRF
ncbi:MAG: hypothetical protein IPL52_16120 [Flavobacteriales bacterium]|nr:hypothetical protein [Flavobacteriales bacterium]